MTESVAFKRAILENPAEDTPRLVYADWLDEHAGFIKCPYCYGDGILGPIAGIPKGECEDCKGTGEVSDKSRERASFIRAQVQAACGFELESMRLWNLLHHSAEWFPDVCKSLNLGVNHWGVMHDNTVHFEHKNTVNEFFVRRGFVDEIRVPLSWLIGRDCERCQGRGHELVPVYEPVRETTCGGCGGRLVTRDDTPAGRGAKWCSSCWGMTSPRYAGHEQAVDCLWCVSGRVGGCQSVLEANPVKKIVVGDLRIEIEPPGPDYGWQAYFYRAEEESYHYFIGGGLSRCEMLAELFECVSSVLTP
jgi:hypothetical protein